MTRGKLVFTLLMLSISIFDVVYCVEYGNPYLNPPYLTLFGFLCGLTIMISSFIYCFLIIRFIIDNWSKPIKKHNSK